MSSSHQKDIYTFITVLSVSCRLFRTTSGMVKQMEEDKLRFGAAAWACAAPRLEKLRFVLAKETLQHMRTTEMCLNRKQDGIKEKVPVILQKLNPQSDSCLCPYSSPFPSWQFTHWCECKVAMKTFIYFFYHRDQRCSCTSCLLGCDTASPSCFIFHLVFQSDRNLSLPCSFDLFIKPL